MYYTYVLKSLKDGKNYIGSTSDLALRLKFHNEGLNKSTKNINIARVAQLVRASA